MFSKQAIAKKVRRWLRQVARQVATERYYLDPTVQKGLAALIPREAIAQITDQVTERVKAMRLMVDVGGFD